MSVGLYNECRLQCLKLLIVKAKRSWESKAGKYSRGLEGASCAPHPPSYAPMRLHMGAVLMRCEGQSSRRDNNNKVLGVDTLGV